MKSIKILIFASLFLISGLLYGKDSNKEWHVQYIVDNPQKLPDSIEIPVQLFAGMPVDSQQLEKFEKKLNKLFIKLKKRKRNYKNQEFFYEYFFYQVHQKVLKEYKKEATFSDLVSGGTYNCLTASILYSHLLHALAVEHEILEYPYHINIIITQGGDTVLLETTSPLAGFINEKEEIEKNIHFNMAGGGNEVIYPSLANSYSKVSAKELTGLLYFNKAVFLINEGNYYDAQLALMQAKSLYPSGRLRDIENYIASLR